MRAIHTIIPTLFEGQKAIEKAPAAADPLPPELQAHRIWVVRPVRTSRRSRFTVRQWPAAR